MLGSKMRLDEFYHAVQQALENADLIKGIKVTKDYANQRLILSWGNKDGPLSTSLSAGQGQFSAGGDNYANLNAGLTNMEAAAKGNSPFNKAPMDNSPRVEDGTNHNVVENQEGTIQSLVGGGYSNNLARGNDGGGTLPSGFWDAETNGGTDQPNGGGAGSYVGVPFADSSYAGTNVFYVPSVNQQTPTTSHHGSAKNIPSLLEKTTARRCMGNENAVITDLIISSDEADDSGDPEESVKEVGRCPKRIDKKTMRTKHLAAAHSLEKSYTCHLCSFKGKSKTSLSRHMMDHTGERPYKCKSCAFECKSASSLKVHQLKHTGEKSFSCEHCSYRTNYRASLKKHEVAVHENCSKLFLCPSCPFKTFNDKRRAAHIAAHEQNLHHTCNVCQKKVYDGADFRKHVRAHQKESKPRQKNIACPECDLKFYNQELLKSHMYQHTGKKEYQCRQCRSEFSAFSNLKKHFAKRHPNNHVFHCVQCNFFADNLQEWNRHPSTFEHLKNIGAQNPNN